MALQNFNAGVLFPTSGNKGYTGNPTQEWLDRTAIKNLEEKRFFDRFAKKPMTKDGYYTTSFYRFTKVSHNEVAEITGNYTQNPADTDIQVGKITVTPKLYGIKNTVATFVEMFEVIHIAEGMIYEITKAVARKIDVLCQDTIYSTLSAITGRITYPDGVTALTGFTSAKRGDNKMTLELLIRGVTILDRRSAPRFTKLGGGMNGLFATIMHNNQAHDLKVQVGSVAILEIQKHTPTEVSNIVEGVVGIIGGTMVFETPFVQTKRGATSNDVVYPAYMIAEGLFGTLAYDYRSVFIPANHPDKGDALGLTIVVGARLIWNAVVLDSDCGQIILTSSSL